MLIDAGAIVTGSEPRPGPQTFELIQQGAKISRDQFGESLDSHVDLVVRSAAVADNNREMIAAHALGLKIIKYAQMLGMVMGERFGVAVAGTHGKSTTSAMIAFALRQCGGDPSFVIGGTVRQLGGSSHSGRGAVFVAEACEFDRSFHNLRPNVALITNIESDHLDYYKDIDEIVGSFRDFARCVPADGVIIANGKDRHVMHALSGLPTPVESASLGREFIWSTRILGIDNGCYRGEVSYRDQSGWNAPPRGRRGAQSDERDDGRRGVRRLRDQCRRRSRSVVPLRRRGSPHDRHGPISRRDGGR